MVYNYYLCLSHDVDRVYKTYQGLYYSVKAIAKGDLGGFVYHLSSTVKENPYWNFEKITDIEDGFGVKSTFFFLDESIRFKPLQFSSWKLSLGRYSWDDPRVRSVIRALDSGGWEIGLHGSYNSYKDPALLSAEKSKLETILGHEVTGVRQHYLNMNDKTWDIQRNLGFSYDSTLGSTVDIGFPEERYYPFKPFNDEFYVVPLIVMDSCLMSKENPREEYQREFGFTCVFYPLGLIYRSDPQSLFMDTFRTYMLREAYKNNQKLGDRLAEAEKQIDWERFTPIIQPIYNNQEPSGGRPNMDPVLMVKLLVLQSWYGLSDPELERQVADRISFQRFLGVPESAPDYSTIWRFRERLAKSGRDRLLWAELQRQLNA